MANEYLDELLQLAGQIVMLADAESTLNKSEWKAAKAQHDALEEQFKKVRGRYVDTILGSQEGRLQAVRSVEHDLNEIRAAADLSWYPSLDYTSEHLLSFLRKEADKSPARRKAVKYTPYAVAVAALVVYLCIRVFSAVPITDPVESRRGIEQRAAALAKIIQYDKLMDTHVRKGGLFKGMLLWPVEPTKAEIAGGREFASLALAAHQTSAERFGCTVIDVSNGGVPTKSELTFLDGMADYVRREDIAWEKTPIMTVLDAARSLGHCEQR